MENILHNYVLNMPQQKILKSIGNSQFNHKVQNIFSSKKVFNFSLGEINLGFFNRNIIYLCIVE